MDYNSMTVPELRELADERGIDVPSSATKAEIIAALKKGNGNGGHVEAQEGEGPVQEEVLVDPYEDFADPVIDGTKPFIDQTTPGNVLQIIVLDGSNLRPAPEGDLEDYDHLVFVQSGRGQEFLTSAAAKRKFGQDKDGQIYYNQHGIDPAELKPVDVVALGT
jgi:hypothetical protein